MGLSGAIPKAPFHVAAVVCGVVRVVAYMAYAMCVMNVRSALNQGIAPP